MEKARRGAVFINRESSMMKNVFVKSMALAAACAASTVFADMFWTASGSTADWSDSGNWSGDGTIVFGGNEQSPVVKGNERTVTFSKMETVSNKAFFIQNVDASGAGLLIFTNAVDVADDTLVGLDIALSNAGAWYQRQFYLGAEKNGMSGRLLIAGGTYRVGGADMIVGFEDGNKYDGDVKGELTVSGGNLALSTDLVLGDKAVGELTVKGSGVVSVGTGDSPKWLKFGNSAAGQARINLEEGGTLKVWHIERIATTGEGTIYFNGGTLESLHDGGERGWTVERILGNTDGNHKVNCEVIAGPKGGVIDVGANYDNAVSLPVVCDSTFAGTITKKGAKKLTFDNAYFAGLAVAEGAGEVVTPGGNTFTSDGGEVFLVSRTNAVMTAAQLAAFADKTVWIENGGVITLSGFKQAFGEDGRQKLFEAAGLRLGATADDAATTGMTGYIVFDDYRPDEGAQSPYSLEFEDGAVYARRVDTASYWVGGASGDFFDKANWDSGTIPNESSWLCFTNSAAVLRSDRNSMKCWSKLTLDRSEGAIELEFRNEDNGNYPTYIVAPGGIEVEGEGDERCKIILTRCGLSASGEGLVLPETIDLAIRNTGGDIVNDSWLGGTGAQFGITVNGDVTIESFLITRSAVVFNGDVALAHGARLSVEGEAQFNGELSFDGYGIFECFPEAAVDVTGATLNEDEEDLPSMDAKVARGFGLYDDSTANYWMSAEATSVESPGDWFMSGNWRFGTPAEGQTILFDRDLVLALSGSTPVIGRIVNNANVEYRTTDPAGVHPSIFIGEISGTGTNSLYHTGFIAGAAPGTIAAESTINILETENGSDSWLETRDNENYPLQVYGNVIGDGYLIVRHKAYFYGDNSAHTGRVLMTHTYNEGDAKHFCAENAGFVNSLSLEVQSGVYLDGEADATFNFGGLTMATYTENNAAGWDFHIIVPVGFSGTMRVGCGGQDVSIPSLHRTAFLENGAAANTDGLASAIMEKVGPGTMTTAQMGAYKLKVLEGAVNFTADNASVAAEVAAGAAVGGAGRIPAPLFEKGAIVRQTVTGPGECDTLKLTGEAVVDGVVFDLVDKTTTKYLYNATDEDEMWFTPLEATSVKGRPEGVIATAMDKIVWKPRARPSGSVIMRREKLHPGMNLRFQ